MRDILSEIVRIGAENNVRKVVLFGSRARGDNHPGSDYDIAFISAGIDEYTKNRIKDRVSELDTLYKIDLVFLNDLNDSDSLTENIIKDGVVLMDKFTVKFGNYKQALARLKEAAEDFKKTQLLSVRDGVIQRFEFTAELAWKTVREYLIEQGVIGINTPKTVMREAFAVGLIKDEDGWISILNDRNGMSHMYSEKEADAVFGRITGKHIALFEELEGVLGSTQE